MQRKLGVPIGVLICTGLAALTIPMATGIASGTKASAVPAKLVGPWTRTVTAEDWKRAGATGFVTSFVGPTPMAVKANGDVSIIDFIAKFSPLPGGRLSISGVPVCYPKRGLYRWKVASRRLTLTKLKDTCAAEVGLFAGVWKRGVVRITSVRTCPPEREGAIHRRNRHILLAVSVAAGLVTVAGRALRADGLRSRQSDLGRGPSMK